jgi:geranylgeranyl diphosphate synthase, type I
MRRVEEPQRTFTGNMKSALEILGEYKGDVEAELERHIPRTGEPREFYAPVWDLLDRGGKRFRPAMTFLASECVGGRREDALGAAATVELLHNMTLVHDDIEDKSELRRGKPCIHIIYGVPTAINVGDSMLIKVFEIANSSHIPQDRCHRLVSQVAKRAYDITWGQQFEFSMWKRKHFTEDEVIRLIKNKTGALTALSTEAGAIAGGGTDEQIKLLGDFGETVGVSFQIIDDTLNVSGDMKEYGKEIGGDIREGKKTLLTAHLLRTANAQDRKAFTHLLGKNNITKQETRKAIQLYEKYGSIDYAKTEAESYLRTALDLVNKLPASEARNNLVSVSKFLVSRSF